MRGAVAFLTPIGKAQVPRPSSLLWFPFVGGAIGALLGLLWWRLAVMKESTSGAFGIASAVAVLLLRWVGLVAIKPSVVLLVGIWAGSRAIMAVVVTSVPYARPEGGLVSAFIAPGP